jgi:hypothetical protein
MKIPKIHKEFYYYLKEPRALTNPEDYLGPNWKDVINFWLYVDGLSEIKRGSVEVSFWNLDEDVRESARDAARSVARKVIRASNVNLLWWASYWVTNKSYVFAEATKELIAQHKILEQDKTLVFLPLCLKP